MKKFFFLLTGLMISLLTIAQSPQGINYQAVVRNESGQVISNDDVNIEISILQGSIDGSVIFTETHNTTTNLQGIVNIIIGSVNSGAFQLIDWTSSPYFISVNMNGNHIGTNQILSVPYAFYANSAGNTFSGDFNDLDNVPENLDTDNSDDFDGDFNNLQNLPEHLDIDSTNDFDGDYNKLTNKPVFNFFWGDKDQDGFGDAFKVVYAPEAPAGFISNSEDCDDENETVYPGADEICDNLDNDCDGEIDEDAVDMQIWFLDSDHDGFGDIDNFKESCFGGENYVINSDDCDDSNEQVNPEADEFCDGLDNDCNGVIDDNPVEAPTWFLDADGDGYGNTDITVIACEQPDGYVDAPYDCDDNDPDINPGSDEVCDGIDNNCNGTVDDNAVDATQWYVDMDEDGFGSDMEDMEFYFCEPPVGMPLVDNNLDCDDENPEVNPNATEILDGMDNDCDGDIDEGFSVECWTDADCESGMICIDGVCTFDDFDGDGYPSDIDCDDYDPEVNPGAEEILGDDMDNDCDGLIDEETEICDDGMDNDADGLTDCEDPDCAGQCGSEDTDGDGIYDEFDNCPYDHNSEQEDMDDDGVGDICDNCIDTPNSDQEDTDGNGIGDACDETSECGNMTLEAGEECDDGNLEPGDGCDSYCALEVDSDDDGIFDHYDNCPLIFNPMQKDVDDDGIGDECDNCIDTPNPEQTDLNHNGIGDACEEIEICDDGIDNDADGLTDCDDPDCAGQCGNEDSDDDGTIDEDDNCPFMFNPEQEDMDADGVGDECDNCMDVPNPEQTDLNDNGIGDDCEEITNCDTDADCPSGMICGANNICEYDDFDGDGYPSNIDCDDNDASINPSAEEIWYDGVDQNCDGWNDFDQDMDGFVADAYVGMEGGTSPEGGDCDDTDMEINPWAEDIPDDGIDQDCNGVDATGGSECGDGVCDAGEDCISCPTDCPCEEDADGDGFTADVDCDDLDENVFPGNMEVCDGLDNDCNGIIDDNAVDAMVWFADNDGDGFGSSFDMVEACEQPAGYVDNDEDCNDNDDTIHPGAYESECSNVDNNCDGNTALDGMMCDEGNGTCVGGECLPNKR